MLAGLLAPLPVTWKNLSLQLILMSGQIEQEQGHRCHFVVYQTTVIKLLNEKTLLDLPSIHITFKCQNFTLLERDLACGTTAEVLTDLSHTGSTCLHVLIKPSFQSTTSFTDITSATAACNLIHKIMFEVFRLSILKTELLIKLRITVTKY